MFFWTILKVALKSLAANKLRSGLAMLGIIIGVGAVIAMLAIGAGAQKAVVDRVSALGTNLLIIRPGQRGTMGVMSGTQQNLTIEDGEAILTQVPNVRAVTPVVGGSTQVKYFQKNARTSVQGVATTYFRARAVEVETGSPITDRDCDANARVAVIGPVTAANLGMQSPLGETVKVNGINFRVVGVMKAKGDQGYYNPDDQVLIPYTTAMKQVFGLTYLREIDVECTAGANLTDVENGIYALIRKRHKTPADMSSDIEIRNQAEMLATMSGVTQTFTMLLGSIAAISLLVGGIGIMNIMLVTVTERTREIGVRKAIGAKDRDILTQFLFESLLMSVLGGALGVALGVGTAELVPKLTQFTTVVQLPGVVLALVFSCCVGVFFGFYPALRASKLDPIEALRYE